MTQLSILKKHLEKVGSITTYEAFEEYGITRLSALIFQLKKKGMKIMTSQMVKINKFGNQITFKKYTYGE